MKASGRVVCQQGPKGLSAPTSHCFARERHRVDQLHGRLCTAEQLNHHLTSVACAPSAPPRAVLHRLPRPTRASHGANRALPAVAHGDRHVAPQPLIPRPAHRRAVEPPLELRLVHGRQPLQRGIDQFRPRLQFRVRARSAPSGSTGRHPGRCRSQTPAAPSAPSTPVAIAPRCSMVRYEMHRVASIW